MATSDSLREQLQETQTKADAAHAAAGRARELHGRLRGLQALSEASAPEVAEAGNQVVVAEDEATALDHAVTVLRERLTQAEAEEAEARRAELKERASESRKAGAAAAKRLDRALASARAALDAASAASARVAGVRAELTEMRDPQAEERAIQERYRERFEELRRTAPEGMEPNTVSLDFRLEADLKAARERVAAEAAELAPSVDAAALQTVVDQYADLLPHLVDSETRRAFSEGHEFTRRPERANALGGRIPFTGRLYGDGEMIEAERRHEALTRALARLGGPASVRIGDDGRGQVVH